jgi:hypothetical protein
MLEEKHVDFGILDVGCDARPKGDADIVFFRAGLFITYLSRKNDADNSRGSN